jgi:triosephosphate isomerase
MNLTRRESVELAHAVAIGAARFEGVETVICPPTVYLEAVVEAIKGTAIGLGAQNAYFEASGAYTGEVSMPMLVDVGCRYVILGHSERRELMRETDADVHRKVKAALSAGLTPIVCLGESLQERAQGRTHEVIARQFSGSLGGLASREMERVIIAYEPIWAIGSGHVATPAQAEEVHGDLRRILETEYNARLAALVRIQYGGSVKAANAGLLLAQPNIDGALVGGASLAAESFLAIVAAAQPSLTSGTSRP